MSTKPRTAHELDLALDDPGFTPAQADVSALIERLRAVDPRSSSIVRALRRVGHPAVLALLGALGDDSNSPAGEVALLRACRGLDLDEALATALAPLARSRLAHGDPRVRREAARALGRHCHQGALAAFAGQALAERSRAEPDESVLRALVEALGRVGEPEAVQAAQTRLGTNAADEAARSRARLWAARSTRDGGEVAPLRPGTLAHESWVVLRCRRGLESVLADELDAMGIRPRERAPGVVVVHTCELAELLRCRVAEAVGMVLTLPRGSVAEAVAARRGGALPAPQALARALSDAGAFDALSQLGAPPLGYRITPPTDGKHRQWIRDVATAIDEASGGRTRNDPRAAPCSLEVYASGMMVAWLGFDDARFAYRVADVPAASHPTVAAALARVGGVRADDVVWDPFVGSGLELCERARLGPARLLVGTDLAHAALDAARRNLERASPHGPWQLAQGDARHPPPGLRPTLVLTNPPLGLRVHRHADLPRLLEGAFRAAVRVLAPRGRFVWLTPLAPEARAWGREEGLELSLESRVDLGGVLVELQRWERR